MRAKKAVHGFTPISGFKRLISCRKCGKKRWSKNGHYCIECSDKIKDE